MFQRPLAPGQRDSIIEPRSGDALNDTIGRWTPVRRLAPHQLAARFVLADRLGAGSAIGYQLTRPTTPDAARSLRALCGLRHGHILPIDEVVTTPTGSCWLIAPPVVAPPRTQSGPLTLRDTLAQRPAGAFNRGEALRTSVQLVATSAWAHERGAAHGPLTVTDVLVSRRCVALFELYGLGASLAAPHPDLRSLAALEARSLGRLAVRLATGRDEPAPSRKLGHALGRHAGAWVGALANTEFTDCRDALRALPPGLAHLAQDSGAGSGSPSTPGPALTVASSAASSAASASVN